MILFVVCVCETWSLTMLKELRLRTGFIGRYLDLAGTS